MVLAMGAPEEHKSFKLGWSLFRGAHQAIARRCHRESHKMRSMPVAMMLIESQIPILAGPRRPHL
jgi:hypothetical protein